MRASSLTLYSLSSIVPVLALLFGLAKGFGMESHLDAWLASHLQEGRNGLRHVMEFSRRALQNAQGGLVAGVGVAGLLYSAVRMISNVEDELNSIWSIAASRPWARKFSDYLSLLIVGPFLLLGAGSLNVYTSSWIRKAAEAAPFSDLFSPMASAFLWFLPWLLLWALITFTYVYLPNTKVAWTSGMFGAALAALAFQAVQSFYIRLQIGFSQANAIYGSLAALPLLLVWMQISWNIVLMGAELSQQHQNYDANGGLRPRSSDLSFRAVKRIGIAICGRVGEAFAKGDPAPTAERLGTGLGLPLHTVRQMLRKLTAARLLVEIDTPEGSGGGYLPVRDPESLTPEFITEALEGLGQDWEAGRAPGMPGAGGVTASKPG